MFQFEAARIIEVIEETISNSENNYTHPKIMYIPKIINLLGYTPKIYKCGSLGKRIIHYRCLRGLSQKKFAEMLKVDQSTLSRWEQNKGNFSNTSKRKLSDFLNSF